MSAAARPAAVPARLVRLRPSVHYAPLDEGILFKNWDRTFTVEGHRALYGLFERLLPLLDQGVERSALLAAVPPHARAVVELLLDRLDENGMCLDGPRRGPSAREAAAFAPAIAYLEGVASDPAAAFAAVRAARVAVSGEGPAALAAIRALVGMGVGNLGVAEAARPLLDAQPLVCDLPAGPPDLVIRFGDPVDDDATALDVLVTGEVALVGPLRHGDGPGLADAIARWRRPLSSDGRPIAPVVAALAGNVAAFEAFRWLAGLPTPTAEGKVCAVTREPLRTSYHPVVARRGDAAEPRRTAPDEIVEVIRALADEATGIIPAPEPGDLPQLPVFTCRAGDTIGWAADPTEAYLRAGFAALRAVVADGRGAFAVAATHEAWLSEGTLAALAPRLHAEGVTRAVAFGELGGKAALLWKTLRLRFGREVAVTHAVSPSLPGAHLAAVSVEGEAAGQATAWLAGEAFEAALLEAVARVQLAEVGVTLPARTAIAERPAATDAPWDAAGSPAGVAVKTTPWPVLRRHGLVAGWVDVDVA